MEDKQNPQNNPPVPPANLPGNGNAPEFTPIEMTHDETLLPMKQEGATAAPVKTPPTKDTSVPIPIRPIVPLKNPAIEPKIIPKSLPEEKQKVPNTIPTQLVSAVGNILATNQLDKPIMKKDDKSFSSLRTYEDDIARVLRNSNASVVKIREAEVKRKEQIGDDKEQKFIIPEKITSKTNWKIIFIGLLVVLLVISGIILIKFAFDSINKEPLPADVSGGVLEADSFFLVNQKRAINITDKNRNALIAELGVLRGGTVGPLGSITQLFFQETLAGVESITTFGKMLDAFEVTAPNVLIRNIDPNFVYGIHVFEGNQPFLVLKTSSYGHAFAGMLDWEKTLEKDMKGIIIPTNTASRVTASTTVELLKKHIFKDKVILNRDTRLIAEDSGDIIMLYSFVNADTIVITTNEDTLKEIVGRLERIRFSR